MEEVEEERGTTTMREVAVAASRGGPAAEAEEAAALRRGVEGSLGRTAWALTLSTISFFRKRK